MVAPVEVSRLADRRSKHDVHVTTDVENRYTVPRYASFIMKALEIAQHSSAPDDSRSFMVSSPLTMVSIAKCNPVTILRSPPTTSITDAYRTIVVTPSARSAEYIDHPTWMNRYLSPC